MTSGKCCKASCVRLLNFFLRLFPKERKKKNLTLYSDLYDTFFDNKIVTHIMARDN